MPSFRVGQTLQENVRRLRESMGSVKRPLSQADLAEHIRERHPLKRPVNSSVVARWESGEVEPDVWSLVVMAQIANVPIETFVAAPTSNALPPQKATPAQLRAADELIEGTKADLAAHKARAKQARRRKSG